MRAIGNLPTEKDAELFCDYLLVLGIESEAEEDEGTYVVWIRSDRDLDEARKQLGLFTNSKDRSSFERSAREAGSRRREAEKEDRQAEKRFVDLQRDQKVIMVMGLPIQRGPVWMTLLGLSVAVSLITGFGTADFGDILMIWDLRQLTQIHQYWRPFTANFLHLGTIHLLLNMLWLAYLGGMIERRRPIWVLLLLVLGCGSIGLMSEVLIQKFVYGSVTAPSGMSGAVYALLGYIFMISTRVPRSGFELEERLMMWMFAWIPVGFVLSYMEIMPIANWAHLGGLFAGALVGYVESLFRNRG